MHTARGGTDGHMPHSFAYSDVHQILNILRHTCHTVHTPQYMDHTPTHAQVASHDTHTLDKYAYIFPASPVTARWWEFPRGLPFNALIN